MSEAMSAPPSPCTRKRTTDGKLVRRREHYFDGRRINHRAHAAKLPLFGSAEAEHAEVQPARRTNVNAATHHRAFSIAPATDFASSSLTCC